MALITESQHERLRELLAELYEYYNESSSVAHEVVLAHLRSNLLNVDSPLRLVVATCPAGEVVGFAAVALLFSLVDLTPQNQRQCLLKELFVKAKERGNGVGRALMTWVAQYAVANGGGRVDWNVQATNHQGIAFYKGLGAEQVAERLSFRLSHERIVCLSREGQNGAFGI